MKYVKHYCADHKKLILAVFTALCAAALLFCLYGLPLDAVAYTWAVVLVVTLAFFVLPDFYVYVRRAKELEALRNSICSLLEFPEPSGPLREKLLGSMVRDLCGKARELETEAAARQAATLEYYTLWVHQIKTPLSAMRLILQAEPGRTSDALLQELFKVERYVEMALGYLRLDSMSSDLRLERCSVHQIVTQAVKKFAPQFIYKRLSLDLQEFDNQVVTDEKWLVFVVEQLLSNALKYTASGGVAISMDDRDVLTIRDTGAGISAEDLPRIFERGFTGYNGRQDKAATGLGLYLSKQILDKLQNRIEILSQPGGGTEVRLYLHRENVTPC